MEVLWIKSDYIDPPDTGGKLRTYNLLRQLHQRCPVTYISLRSDRPPLPASEQHWATKVMTVPYVEKRKSGLLFMLRVLAAMLSSTPYIVQKYRSIQIETFQKQLAAEDDSRASGNGQTVLVCDFLEMAGNVAWNLPIPKVLFQHNVESVIWRRYYENEANWLKKAYFWFEHRRLANYEREICNRFDLVLAVSTTDRDVMRRELGVRTPIEVIETGVDTDYFSPAPQDRVVPGRLVFLGSLDWMPNIDGIEWFVRDVYPKVKQQHPQVSFDIVGRRPSDHIRALAANDSTIRVCADVPDVRPYLATADQFVVPLRIGSGTRLKIYEAMAMRCPVVSTSVGAEGLPLIAERHLRLADSAPDFADTISQLLLEKNRSQRDAIATAAYQHVTQNYSWWQVGNRLHDVCLRLNGNGSAKGCA